ncbi:MAG TPA: site-specific DNA-methyltransferase [Caldithrix sp.]|nr:site-specific DNA-methyltransferase [Caldithrix sp.]
MKNKKTKTSSFGVSGRVSHDSKIFYSSNLYNNHKETELPDNYMENKIDDSFLNKIFLKSSEKMDELADNSLHLMITSPPYNVGKEYDANLTLEEYFDLLKSVFSEVHRVLVWGGRACINIANVGRKPYIPLHSYLIQLMLEIGFFMRGEIIWNKGSSSGTSTAWGSWCSATNPTLRDIHEYILIFSKGSFSRKKNIKNRDTILKTEFLEFTKSIWTFPTESAKRVNHPAPFPLELPYRLIQLYSFEHDIILDPFCGSGTTCLAAQKTNRYYIGYEIEAKYHKFAEDRLRQLEIPLHSAVENS